MPRQTSPESQRRPLFVPSGQEGETVEGRFSVDHITYANAETGYAVVRLVPVDTETSLGIVAVGVLGQAREGECYQISGVWRSDPRFGMQVRIQSALREAPRSLEAIRRYLAGASIKGLGDHYAQVLVDHFGEETYQELQAGGQHLCEVPGIGPKRAATIRESWAEHQGLHDLMVNLQGVAGLSPNQAQRLLRQYGRQAWDMVQQNPYRLAEEVRGFGFRTCDQIGRSLGIAHDDPARIQAGLLHLLQEALGEGHLWTERQDVLQRAAELLQVEPEAVGGPAQALINGERVIQEVLAPTGAAGSVEALFLPQVARTEQRLASLLRRFLSMSPVPQLCQPSAQARALVAQVAQAAMTDEQRAVVESLLTGKRLVLLTGGPGTGKTTTVRSLIACLEQLHVRYALCATTGRASKQLAAATQRRAATVHRHLGIGQRDQRPEPVGETVLVIDEASMIDLWLMEQIAERLTERTHVVLVGDVDQLPPVGPGAILQDLISAAEGGELPGAHVTRLSRIFRQEAGQESYIIANCHRIRRGERPLAEVPSTSDYFEMVRETPQQALELAVGLVSQRLPEFLKIPPEEIQVLAPMHGGVAGIRALNAALQAVLNPPAPGKAEMALPQRARGGDVAVALRAGDKVRQMRNDYQKRVFNGDLGIVKQVNPANRTAVVQFDEVEASYASDDLDDLVHAWAMTVHSAQGSQWPAVVIVMLKSHYVMLERNILYTALSRAERLAVLITQDQAVRIAVQQARSTQRRTNLVARLQARG